MIWAWIAAGLVGFWLLVRRRLFELWRDVQAMRRQVDLQLLRRRELARRLADALADRLDDADRAALLGDDEDRRTHALTALPAPADDEPAPVAHMRRELADVEHRRAAYSRVLDAENARYRWLAPAWIGRLVGAPLPSALPVVDPAALDDAR